MNLGILFGLAAGTLLSEDLTLIGAGLLARDGVIGLVPAIAACAAGVYVGDLALWLLAGSMLAWAVNLWMRGTITPGEVVVVSALTFRILHGSRDLALALIGTTQHFSFIAETLRVIGQPHTVADAPDVGPFRSLGGSVALRNVSFA